jgi:multiple RNA-binding domain-containing protein 1
VGARVGTGGGGDRRGDDGEEETKGKAKGSKDSGTKMIVRNVAFEATKRDLSQLFAPFGQLKSLRMPRKFDGSHRGFAFIDFVTKKEAANAYAAVKNTHLHGRHLVLEYAKQDEALQVSVKPFLRRIQM